MKNKILNRKFFIKKDNGVYCGKCGKKLPGDSYNLKKHAASCGFTTEIEPKVFENGKDYAYAFQISKDGNTLNFFSFRYNLINMPGFHDKYSSGKWERVYTARFKRGSRTVEEKGLYNIDIWMKKMLDNMHIPSLSADADITILHAFFPDVIGIESFGSFLDLYRNKSYGNLQLDVEKFKKSIPDCSEELKKQAEDFLYYFAKQGTPRHLKVIVDGKMKIIDSRPAMHLFIHCSYKRYESDSKRMQEKSINAEFLIMDGCIVSSFDDVLTQKILKIVLGDGCEALNIKNNIPKEELEIFNELYPKFMIKQYMNSGGCNILIPFLSSNYSKCMELLYKAGLPTVVENYCMLKIMNNDILYYENNIKEIFGVSVKTMRRVCSSYNIISTVNFFQRLKEISIFCPKYLSLSDYGAASIDFLMSQNITRNRKSPKMRFSSKEINRWTDDELFHTLKYLNRQEHIFAGSDTIRSLNMYKETNNIWVLYIDYIRISGLMGRYIDGKWPKNLQQAHNSAAGIYEMKLNKEKESEFRNIVQNEEYLSLIPTKEEDEKLNSEFSIYAPKNIDDLFDESIQMHNCVKTYAHMIIQKSTMIYFLRRKENPKKSVCTIQITPEKELIQMKAYANSMADSCIKEFVKKWAAMKGITLKTLDVM